LGQDGLEELIAEAARRTGCAAPEAALPSLAAHLRLVLRWNRAMSLTAVRSPSAAVESHVVESLLAAAWVDPGRGPLLDVGSGNGYPAIPIKCVLPSLRVTLLEPSLRKSVFLKRAARELGLEGVEVLPERIERPSDLLRRSPLGTVTMRAVARIDEILEGAPGALATGGRLILFLGGSAAGRLAGRLPPALTVRRRIPLPWRPGAELVVLEGTAGAG
jgi:16S rRNA (guanine527-N7)-methyltransferase